MICSFVHIYAFHNLTGSVQHDAILELLNGLYHPNPRYDFNSRTVCVNHSGKIFS
jgi:hypothetical protein